MFIYLLALVATTFLIFGLLHIKCLSDWLQSSIRSSMTLYNGLVCRPTVGVSLNNEHVGGSLSERPVTLISDRVEFEDFQGRGLVGNKERLSDVHLEESGNKARGVNSPRYSFEDLLPEERDRDLGLTGFTARRNLQLGTTREEAIKTSKREANENIFETLKNSIEKASPYSTSRINTRPIYNLLLKETVKENEGRQKLLDANKNIFNEETPADVKDQLPSSSENKAEREENDNK